MLVKLFFCNRIIHMCHASATNNRYTIQFEQVYALLNTLKGILKWFVFI